MQDADRKAIWSGVVALAVIAGELAWFLSLGPANQGGHPTANQESYYWEWITSAAFWTALFTGFLTWSTIGLWRQTRRLAEGAESQAEDTKKSLSIAKQSADAAVAAQRPWLFVEITILSPMTFGDDGPSVRLGFDIHNVGNTPATHVQFWPFVLAQSKGDKTNAMEPAMFMARAWAEKMRNVDMGLIAFPGIAPRQEQTHEIWTELRPDFSKNPHFQLDIAVAISYRFVGGSGYTENGFSIRMRGRDENWIDAAGGPIYGDDLSCIRHTLWDAAR